MGRRTNTRMTTSARPTQPHKPAGSPGGTGGQFASVERAEAPDVDLDDFGERPPDGDAAVLVGELWHLPAWDTIDKSSDEIMRYCHEVARRQITWQGIRAGDYVVRGDLELHASDLVEDVTQDALGRIYRKSDEMSRRGETIRSSGDFVAGITKMVAREHLRGKASSADQLAGFTFRGLVADKEQALGRHLTRKEEDEIACQVRDQWPAEQTRKPRVDFHRAHSTFTQGLDAAATFGLTPSVGMDGTANGSLDEEREASRRHMRIVNERKAAQIFARARAQTEEMAGRPLNETESGYIVAQIMRNWNPHDPRRPRPDFHLRSTSYETGSTERWTEAAMSLTHPDEDLPAGRKSAQRRIASMCAWNVVAEQEEAPRARRASLGPRTVTEHRRVVQEAGGVERVCRDWRDGTDTPATEALFAPYEIHSESDREAVVDRLLRNRALAEDLWKSAVSIANERNEQAFASAGI